MFWTRAILWKIIKVLGYLIGMVRYYPARKKKYFFCPILDTSTALQSYSAVSTLYHDFTNKEEQFLHLLGCVAIIGVNKF